MGQNLLKTTRLPLNEQVEGANLLGNCKVGTFRTGQGQILYRTSKSRRFVQELPQSCTGGDANE